MQNSTAPDPGLLAIDQSAATPGTPLFDKARRHVSDVCGGDENSAQLLSETVESVTIATNHTYRTTIEARRSIHAGGLPAGVHGVASEQFAATLDALVADNIAARPARAKAWLARAARAHATRLTSADLLTHTTHIGYTCMCAQCTGKGGVPCENCNARGVRRCGHCAGKGKLDCTRCHTTQRVTCSACFGHGGEMKPGTKTDYNPVSNEPYQVATSTYETCFLCGGDGRLFCHDCSGGYNRCIPCGNSGTVGCGKCNATGTSPCATCDEYGQVAVVGSAACTIEQECVTFSKNETGSKPLIKRLYEAGTLAPWLAFTFTDGTVDGATVTTQHAAVFDVTTADIALQVGATGQRFAVRAVGPALDLVDFDGLLEAVLEADLARLALATGYGVYFSGKQRQALTAALAAALRLDAHRALLASASASASDAPGAGGESLNDAYRSRATAVLRRATRHISSAYHWSSVLAAIGAGLVVTALAVEVAHRPTLPGFGAGIGVALVAWLAGDVLRRHRLRKVIGKQTYADAKRTHARALHLKTRPAAFLIWGALAFAGLGHVLPGTTFGPELRTLAEQVRPAPPMLTEAHLDLLLTPATSTFIENREQLVAALPSLRRSAEQGNAKALAALGRVYLYGIGVPEDLAEADRYITRAEAAGGPQARAARAFYNLHKRQPKATRLQGLKVMKELAAAGSADADLYLGLLYDARNETLVKRAPREAARYLRQAAAKGSARAQEHLAGMAGAGARGAIGEGLDQT